MKEYILVVVEMNDDEIDGGQDEVADVCIDGAVPLKLSLAESPTAHNVESRSSLFQQRTREALR